MLILQKDLIQIIEKSSTISDRLGNLFLPNDSPCNEEIVNRIANWCQTVAEGNQEKFEKRIAWDDLELNTIRDVLGSVRLADEQNLPVWAEILKAALEATTSSSLTQHILNPQKPLPFEEIFLSFIYIARQKLQTEAGSSYSLLSLEAHASFERYLLKSLTDICSQAMGINFQIFRMYEEPTLIRRLGQLQASQSQEQYYKFINKMLSGGLLAFFQEYSVLARLTATITDFWVNNTCEFLQRLESDWSAIQTTFHAGVELGKVVAVEGGLSDLHHKGRSVIAVTFASGLKLIYKPKDLGLEENFFQLLATWNEKGMSPPLKLLRILNRSDYGWVEYVEHLPCLDQQAAVRYYQRFGILLCLVYTLSGTDFHQENIIACGEYPVLIDLEMLMAAKAKEEESFSTNINASNLAFEQFTYSVVSTSLLPKWEMGRDGSVYDISGLSGNGGQKTDFRRLVWQYVNTDGMFLSQEPIATKISANIPTLDGVNLRANDYLEELVDGFRQMYQFLVAHKEKLLAVNSPLVRLAHQRVRSIFRPSQVYATLIKNLLEPQYLQNGVDYSIALDVLSKSLLKFETKPHTWQIIAAERQALMHMDIPLFTTRTQSKDLKIDSCQFIEGYFIESGYNVVMTRLQQLNEDDLEQQIGLIRGSLYTGTANNFETSLQLTDQSIIHLHTTSLIPKEVLVQQAVDIAQELQFRAIRATDGSVTWMGMDYLPEAGRFQQRPMSYDLYDGSSGVALFLAALAKVSSSGEFYDLALGVLKPIHNLLQDLHSSRSQAIIKKMGIGGGKGLGSIIYSLVWCSQFLAEPTLLLDAQRLASFITPTTDKKFDIISGSAGAILGLLALYKATEHPILLELANTCGYHLINNRILSQTGKKTWATVGGKLLTGISHGAAGIAYALLRLSTFVDEPIFLQAAEEAFAYERSVFSEQAQNWPDFRGEKPRFDLNWCNGASGIGLARLGSLAILDTTEIRQDIEVALQTTQKCYLQNIDHLCCGNFGRIETLLVASQILKQSELLEIAQKHAALVMNKTKKLGYFQIFPGHFRGLYNPSFFQGTAGIGYELLRLAYPEQLPCVLIWE